MYRPTELQMTVKCSCNFQSYWDKQELRDNARYFECIRRYLLDIEETETCLQLLFISQKFINFFIFQHWEIAKNHQPNEAIKHLNNTGKSTVDSFRKYNMITVIPQIHNMWPDSATSCIHILDFIHTSCGA